MCRMFAGQDPESYEQHTRSIRLGGHCTSIRLEAAFWNTLDDIAAGQGLTTPKFLTKLHDEVLDLHGDVKNFASLLRCACLVHLNGRRDLSRTAPLAPRLYTALDAAE